MLQWLRRCWCSSYDNQACDVWVWSLQMWTVSAVHSWPYICEQLQGKENCAAWSNCNKRFHNSLLLTAWTACRLLIQSGMQRWAAQRSISDLSAVRYLPWQTDRQTDGPSQFIFHWSTDWLMGDLMAYSDMCTHINFSQQLNSLFLCCCTLRNIRCQKILVVELCLCHPPVAVFDAPLVLKCVGHLSQISHTCLSLRQHHEWVVNYAMLPAWMRLYQSILNVTLKTQVRFTSLKFTSFCHSFNITNTGTYHAKCEVE